VHARKVHGARRSPAPPLAKGPKTRKAQSSRVGVAPRFLFASKFPDHCVNNTWSGKRSPIMALHCGLHSCSCLSCPAADCSWNAGERLLPHTLLQAHRRVLASTRNSSLQVERGMRWARETGVVGRWVMVCVAANLATVAQPLPQRASPCADSRTINATWCNSALPVAERVAALVRALLPAEKAGLLTNVASAVPRLALPTYDWWNEAVHGFARVQVINQTDGSTHDVHVNATSFPMSIG
jgi:hypothetical protein